MKNRFSNESCLTVNHYETANNIACHLPDVLLDWIPDLQNTTSKEFLGVLLFADVSGFTSLCEKYSKTGQAGINELTTTLNNVFGQILESLLNYNGDIYKFAGDALLCHWPVADLTGNFTNYDYFIDKFHDKLKLTLQNTIKCAVEIQDRIKSFKLDDEIVLQIKLAISHGNYIFHVVGSNLYTYDSYNNIIAVGPAVKSVNNIETFCEPGDILVSLESWTILNQNYYIYHLKPGSNYVKIVKLSDDYSKYFLDVPYIHEKNYMRIKLSISHSSVEYTPINCNLPYPDSLKTLIGQYVKLIDSDTKNCSRQEITFTLRDIFTKTLTKSDMYKFKTFLIKPISQKINDNQPSKFFSELRCVTILFINFDLVFESNNNENVGYRDVNVYQQLFVTIHQNVSSYGGVLTKSITFDKGCSFLCVFGLPGITHMDDSYHALKCSYKLYKFFLKNEYIKTVSIGITTGLTFIGVVGHPFRCEYTVIGSKVNTAARLMSNYPGIISCDSETYYSSKLPKKYFQALTHKELKGLDNQDTMWEYEEESGEEIVDIDTYDYPIIGREKELNIIDNNFNNFISNKEFKKYILILGENGIGKTRFLRAIVHSVKTLEIQTISIKAQIDNFNREFSIMSQIIILLLEMTKIKENEREKLLLKIMEDKSDIDDLHLFNHLFKTNFKVNKNNFKQVTLQNDISMLNKKMSDLAFTLFENCMNYLCNNTNLVIVIDDLHNCDKSSINFIKDIGCLSGLLIVLSLRSPAKSYHEYLPDKRITLKIELEKLNSMYLTTVACQMLGVVKIPAVIKRLIVEKSQGIPAWCEELLRELYYNSYIEILPIESIDPNEMQFYEDGLKQFLVRIDSEHAKRSHAREKVCKISNTVDLGKMSFPEGMQSLILSRIDRLNEDDALVIKTASIFGVVFLKSMLKYVLDNMSEERFQESIARLMQQSIFKCGSSHKNMNANVNPIFSKSFNCYCFPSTSFPDNISLNSTINDLQFRNCKLLSFNLVLMQEVTEKLFTVQTAQEIHKKATEFLETNTWKCRACGGDDLVIDMNVEKISQLVTKSTRFIDTVNKVLKKIRKTKNVNEESQLNTRKSLENWFKESKKNAMESKNSLLWITDKHLNNLNSSINISNTQTNSQSVSNQIDENENKNKNLTFKEKAAAIEVSINETQTLIQPNINCENTKTDKDLENKTITVERSSMAIAGSKVFVHPPKKHSVKYNRKESKWHKAIIIAKKHLKKCQEINNIKQVYVSANDETLKEQNFQKQLGINKTSRMKRTESTETWIKFNEELNGNNIIYFPMHKINSNFDSKKETETNQSISISKLFEMLRRLTQRNKQPIIRIVKPIKLFQLNSEFLMEYRSFRKFHQNWSSTMLNVDQRRTLIMNHKILTNPTNNCYNLEIKKNPSIDSNMSYDDVELIERNIYISSTSEYSDFFDEKYEIDINTCVCQSILSNVLAHIIKHANSAGMIEHSIFFMTEYATCLLTKQNSFSAFSALAILKKTKEIYDLCEEENETFSFSIVDRTRLHNLLGLAHFQLNEIDQSFEYFNISISLIGSKLLSIIESSMNANLSYLDYRLCEEASFAYTYLYPIYKHNRDYSQCKLIADKHIEVAQLLKTDLKITSIAYSQAIEQCFYAQKIDLKQPIELANKAINNAKKILKTVSDFQCLAQIFYMGFIINFSNGELYSALNDCIIAKKLLSFVNDKHSLLKIFPELFLCILSFCESIEVPTKLLQQFKLISYENDNNFALLCYDFLHLEMGLTYNVVTKEMENSLDNINTSDSTLKMEPILSFCIHTTVMLWYCRNNIYKESQKHYSIAINMKYKIKSLSFLFSHGVLKLIEYQLALYVELINTHKSKNPLSQKFLELLLINQKTDIFDYFKIFSPRLQHYQAYYKKISGKSDKSIQTFLNNALKIANEMKLVNEIKFIKNSQKSWFKQTKKESENKFYLLKLPIKKTESNKKFGLGFHRVLINTLNK